MGRRNKPLIVKHTDHRLDLGPAGHNLFISRDKQLAERSARRLRLGMRVVVALLVTLGALAALLAVWFYLVPFFHREFQVDGASSQESSLSQEEEEPALPVYDDMGLPVYGDEVNLFVINESQPAEADVVPQLEEAEGVQVDARIADAVTLLAAAARLMPWVEWLASPILQLVKATPVASFVILALVWVRGRELSVLISFLMALPVLYSAVRTGIAAADGQLLEMARVFRIPAGRRLRAIWLPAVLPAFREGCRTALGLCWKSGVAAEVIGLPDGSIGDALYRAKITLSTGELFAWTFVIICLSAAFERAFLALLGAAQRRVCGPDSLAGEGAVQP